MIHDSDKRLLKRYRHLIAALIAYSIGYFTPLAALRAIQDYKNNQPNFCEFYLDIAWICTDCVITVDSGQAGFFDDDYYKENQGGDFGDITTLFGLACSLTLSKNHGGIMLDKGVVSETGFGDGSYSLYIGKNEAGKIVSASIIFIADDELEA